MVLRHHGAIEQRVVGLGHRGQRTTRARQAGRRSSLEPPRAKEHAPPTAGTPLPHIGVRASPRLHLVYSKPVSVLDLGEAPDVEDRGRPHDGTTTRPSGAKAFAKRTTPAPCPGRRSSSFAGGT